MVEQAIGRQLDMAVVARCASLDGLLDAAVAANPDIVVVGVEGPNPPRVCLELMLEHRGVSVLGIEAQTGRAWLYELRLEQIQMDEVAPTDVVRSIRAAVYRRVTA